MVTGIVLDKHLEMGCMCAKKETENNEQIATKRVYSWDEKKKALNPDSFLIENLKNEEEIRVPGSINGQQFIIQNCQDSTIYILDYINTITIDDCVNCHIILGPVEGSAFIRNCKSCTCMVACGQFRMRDSTKINVFLFSATQPIIEASSEIYFGDYRLKYNDIQNHFEKANLNKKFVNWKHIYDFTPVECEQNWSFLKTDNISEFLLEPKMDVVKEELAKVGHCWGYVEFENAV